MPMSNTEMAVMSEIRKKRKKRSIVYRRRTTGEKVLFAAFFVFFAFICLTYILTFLWMILSSFKENLEFFNDPFGLPAVWHFSNFAEAMQVLEVKGVNFVGMILNSVWYSFGATILGQLNASVYAYIFAKYRFPGRNAMWAVIFFMMFTPIYGSQAASYELIYRLHLNDSPLYLITGIGSCTGILYLYGVYRGVPGDYADAARIDGAGHFYTYFRVMMPFAYPVMFAMGMSGFIGVWNDYMTPLMYFESLPTLASGLYFYRVELQYASNEPLFFAGAVLSCLPPVLVFCLCQSQIFDKVAIGGLKG